MAILRPDKDKDKTKRPRVLLIPPPDLPVPAVQGGAVETLLTHLIRENEREGKLDLLCASVPDEAARRAAEGLQHTKMLYIARPHGHRRYWPMVFIERCLGIAAPYDPWYQKVQLSLALEPPGPDLIVAEGGNLTQCSAISRMFGRRRCLAHLHGQTSCSPVMDTIYGGILALSQFIRDDYLKTSTLDPNHAYIWYNCVDTKRFRPGPPPLALRTRLGFGERDFVVLFCGRLDPDKGIHKLMEALSLLNVPQIKLLIVGSPFFGRTQQSSFLRKLEQQARTLGNRVQFTGYIPNEDLPDYYRLADLVCVPTLVEEAAGLVAVEAMACGRPVLATRSGGMPEYLEGSQAVLVERGDNIADQLAWSIRMLYEHPALCAEMGAAGSKRAQDFSVERYYNEFVRIVQDMLQNGGAL
ncbi:glycosyltransferase family 4 protein [Subdoligranulum variabile]|uniref:Glycosyltransferase, group 1 family protein n=1 Tax=Subdoligranulum variabile DSM 15176 TaxID=411471 RepID=D1PNS6_9FIRM|nr:glycosyltransferase family 4 protein [Subdoligranulum variabile]EFB76211.1 glycosyltransferase, group 1 family protein [Subdoligranulum variabile DSM 15176]UWP68845.1 glycosyltransferase family 4 protein [Subdoligranulum variabile]